MTRMSMAQRCNGFNVFIAIGGCMRHALAIQIFATAIDNTTI